MEWQQVARILPRSFRCGYCGREVTSERGWSASGYEVGLGDVTFLWAAICPRCELPSLVDRGGNIRPAPPYGDPVEHLPDDVHALYEEARRAVTEAPNSAAYACRKILMHLAVDMGAEAGETFASYVRFLDEQRLTPPGSTAWVDEIRELGNDANHEIALITQEEAETIVDFTTMLLRLVYEYPERGRRSVEARRAKEAT